MLQNFEISKDYAQSLDDADILFSFRERFLFPKHAEKNALYFCGNSLGLQPRSVSYLMDQELKDWAQYGVAAHFRARNPWFSYHHLFSKTLAQIVGAKPDEVIAMNSLTVNLHLLLLSFYRPNQAGRHQIIMEAGAFPSDQYALASQVRLYGLNPSDTIIEVKPRAGMHIVEEADIEAAIQQSGNKLALVLLSGINYYTGQWFDLKRITTAAHKAGAYAGYDLAHAAGNVPLCLHEWQVDFACWCSYKYLNSGPGGVGGAFVHERHGNNPDTFRLAGWWGHEEQSRFKMEQTFVPQKGAAGWQISGVPVLNMVAHLASLDIFAKTDWKELRGKSILLTAYLEFLLQDITHLPFRIITPAQPERRGCQLSLLFADRGKEVFEALSQAGVVADWREPNVIRLAPVPLYNTFEEVYCLYEILKNI
jgi:kynureninase